MYKIPPGGGGGSIASSRPTCCTSSIEYKVSSHYKKIGYNINVLQQTACLVVNPITVGNFAFLFNCTPVGRTSDYDGSDLKTYLLMRW